MTALLDANALIALTVTDHIHHEVVEGWFSQRTGPFATCPVTQGALVRFLLRTSATAAQAIDIVRSFRAADGHEFWADTLAYDEVAMHGVVGHRQVTDAYLAGLARKHRGQLVTLDRALALMHDDVALLLGADI